MIRFSAPRYWFSDRFCLKELIGMENTVTLIKQIKTDYCFIIVSRGSNLKISSDLLRNKLLD